jgi:hypothetical protein
VATFYTTVRDSATHQPITSAVVTVAWSELDENGNPHTYRLDQQVDSNGQTTFVVPVSQLGYWMVVDRGAFPDWKGHEPVGQDGNLPPLVYMTSTSPPPPPTPTPIPTPIPMPTMMTVCKDPSGKIVVKGPMSLWPFTVTKMLLQLRSANIPSCTVAPLQQTRIRTY